MFSEVLKLQNPFSNHCKTGSYLQRAQCELLSADYMAVRRFDELRHWRDGALKSLRKHSPQSFTRDTRAADAAYARRWRTEINPASYRRTVRKAAGKSRLARLPQVLARRAAVQSKRAKVCAYCGSVFHNRKATARYCKPECSRAALAAKLPARNVDRKRFYRESLADSYVRKLLTAAGKECSPRAIEAKRRELRRARRQSGLCEFRTNRSPEVGLNAKIAPVNEPRSPSAPASRSVVGVS
jgi:hypothetical protein